jgi:hypothetical protein
MKGIGCEPFCVNSFQPTSKESKENYRMPYNSGMFQNVGKLRGVPGVCQAVRAAAVHSHVHTWMSKVLSHIIIVTCFRIPATRAE